MSDASQTMDGPIPPRDMNEIRTPLRQIESIFGIYSPYFGFVATSSRYIQKFPKLSEAA